MACVILHNGIHIDTWYNIEHFEVVNNLYLIKYKGKWYYFDRASYNVGYFWVTPDIIQKQELNEEFINKKIDEVYKQLEKELVNED